MRIINTKYLKEGMQIGKTIYSHNGEILLEGEVTLTEKTIKDLKEKKIPSIYISNDIKYRMEDYDAIGLELKATVIETIKYAFENMKHSKKNKEGLISEEAYEKVKKKVNIILDNLNKNHSSIFNMIEIMSTDLSTYTHCISVAVLSILTGISLRLNEKEIIEIGIGALLLDIGMTHAPSHIINKPGALTEKEFDEIKKHTIYGYNMIKDNEDISHVVKTIVLMHHERLDGSGYPLSIKNENINKFVRIVSICDMFHALVSDRVYRPRIPVYEALELLESQTISKLDVNIYKAFLENINIYPTGTAVILNTGEKGIVIENNKAYPTRPKIKIIYNKNGNFNASYKVVDLMKELTLFVENTCEIII